LIDLINSGLVNTKVWDKALRHDRLIRDFGW
jgi:hypothetical protein